MHVGITLVFDGKPGRGMNDIAAAALRAQDAGIHSVWFPEHVVFVNDAKSTYPYGTLRMGRQPGLFDPLIALTVAAAATSTIRLGTGVLILPIREPLTLAQQVVSLDHASHGRFDLGIGVGWLREEFEALSVPWEHRGERTDEYVEVLRKAWTDEVVTHHGVFVNITGVQAWPKPVQPGGPPILVGGNTPAAIRRTARLGDGWFGWQLSVAEVAECIGALGHECERIGRNVADIDLKVGVVPTGRPADLRDYAQALSELGVGELVVVTAPTASDRFDEIAALGK